LPPATDPDGAARRQIPDLSGKGYRHKPVLKGLRSRLPDATLDGAAVRDWQVISYGNTLHGFTNPAADGSMMRTALYSAPADRRSWASMRDLLDEAFR
jgi:dienelactone hydrolase